MFKRLETKIKFIIYFMIVFILSASVIFITYSIERIYTDEYVNKTKELAFRYSQRTDYYIESIEKLAQQIVNNRIVINTAESDINNLEINSVLTEKSQSNDTVLGVSLYSRTNSFFSDKVIGSAPNFDFIYDSISDFANSEETLKWIIRTPETYDGYYMRSSYTQSTQGLYTCVCKVLDESGSCNAYLLIDTNLKNIFELYAKDSVFLKKMDLFIQNEKIIGYKNNSGNLEKEIKVIENNSDNIVSGNVIYMFYPLRNSDSRLVMCVMTNGFLNTMRIIIFLVIVVALLFALFFIFMSRGLIKSIVDPIRKLREKISDYDFDEE